MKNLMKETNKKVYLIRKSWLDESNEFGRSTDLDVAIAICPSGFTVYDEDGNIIHTTVTEDKYKFGKSWVELKSDIEKELLDINNLNILTFPYIAKFKKYIEILESALILMNETEIKDSKTTDYEKMWGLLKDKLEINTDNEYHNNNEFLNIMKEIEEGDIKDEGQQF